MGRLYVNQTLEKEIRQYCELNEIEDINAFANRCLKQGFSVVKFGVSPKDNIIRENKGIKDLDKNEHKKQTKESQPQREEERKRVTEEIIKTESTAKEEDNKEEKVKTPVIVRKIRVIKKN